MRGTDQPSACLDSTCCFAHVFGSHATIRQLVLSHLTKEDADAVRQVSRDARAAVNDNVKTVKCHLDAPRSRTELAAVFPQANRLHVVVQTASYDDDDGDDDDGDDDDDQDSEEDVCDLLESILATSPALVTKLQALKLSLGYIGFDDDDADDDSTTEAAVACFLPR
jgi:hypothetical protein